MRVISCLAEDRFASQEGPCSMEWVIKWNLIQEYFISGHMCLRAFVECYCTKKKISAKPGVHKHSKKKNLRATSKLLGTTVQNLGVQETWHPGSVYPCVKRIPIARGVQMLHKSGEWGPEGTQFSWPASILGTREQLWPSPWHFLTTERLVTNH